MYLQNVSMSKPSNSSFKCRVVVEGGGSNKKLGSLKELVQTNSGEDLFTLTGTINDDPKGFHGNEHFNKLIAKAADIKTRLENDIKSYKARIAEDHMTAEEEKSITEKLADSEKNLKTWNALPEREKKITRLALLLPGTIQGKRASFLPNLLKTDGKPLTDIDLCGSVREMRKKDLLADGFNARTDFVPLKDLGATGVEIASLILRNPDLSKRATKGFYAVAVHPGGGFGSVDIRFKNNDKVVIQTNESGHDLYFDPKVGKEIRLGKMGPSVGCVIENYAKGFGIKNPDDISALMATGIAQMASDEQFTLKTQNDEKAIKVLLDTNAYKVVTQNSVSTTLRLKDSGVGNFMNGSKEAIDAYAHALSRHAITKINQGANLYVVSSPMTMGLDRMIKKHPDAFGAIGMRELILKKIDERVGTDLSCNMLRKDNGFDVVCNPSMSIKDNTRGGGLILAGKSSFERRGEWIEVSKRILKKVKP
ncbi:hypothetical protein KBA27_03790 [bacterium]|nr:hypothetical protein [bacterium]